MIISVFAGSWDHGSKTVTEHTVQHYLTMLLHEFLRSFWAWQCILAPEMTCLPTPDSLHVPGVCFDAKP